MGRTDVLTNHESRHLIMKAELIALLGLEVIAMALPTVQNFQNRSQWGCVDVGTPFFLNLPAMRFDAEPLRVNIGQTLGGPDKPNLLDDPEFGGESYITKSSSVKVEGTGVRISIGSYLDKRVQDLNGIAAVSTICH